MEQHKTGSLSFSYSDALFCCHFNHAQTHSHMVKDHTLAYVYSGELLIEDDTDKLTIRSGDCVFFRKNHRVKMTRQSYGDEQFQAVFLAFNRKFLRKLYQNFDKSQLPQSLPDNIPNFKKIRSSPEFTSLFHSMIPFFNSTTKPSDKLMDMKVQEGVFALLNTDIRFSAALFDFIEPWKMDIMEFMNENYMYDLSLEDIASFTGRSLASFKRDFSKICDISPQKWIMSKRIEAAHYMIKEEGKKASDVYLQLGFKNLSHFSTAFKKQYGHAPTQ